MSEGAFTTTVSVGGLAPTQRQHLDAQLRSEGIPATWLGDSIQVDQAFESRLETLIAEARSTPAPPPGAPLAAPGYATPPPPAPGYPAPAYPPAPYAPAGYAPAYGYPVGPAPVTNSNATTSLVLAIIGWAVCPIASIFGVIYARRALDEIEASRGTQTGEGLAKAGLIGSWVILGIWGLMIVGFIVFFVILAIVGAAASTA